MPRRMVAIEPLYDKDVSPGGIIIPDSAKERCDQGLVKYIGAECSKSWLGAHVIYSPYSGQTLQIEGEGTLILMPERELVAIIQPQEVEVDGLYFRDSDGNYNTVNYEQAMWLIATNLNVVNKVDRSYDKRQQKAYYGKYTSQDFSDPHGTCDKCGAVIHNG